MPLPMSVRPTASHTRTPLGTGIIVAPAPRRQRPPTPVAPKPGSAHGRCPAIQYRRQFNIAGNSISSARTAGAATPSPAGATSTCAKPFAAARRSRRQREIKLAVTSACRATSRTTAPDLNAAATIACFCSTLHRRRRAGPTSTSTLAIAPSLAPVQNTGVCTTEVDPEIETVGCRRRSAARGSW